MMLRHTGTCLVLLAGVIVAVCGCSTPNVNPATARSDRGYVDIYSVPRAENWWQVDVFDPRRGDYREFTQQFKAPEGDIFRVEARPGRYKARIALVNRAVKGPVEVEVEVKEGMLTAIRVEMEPVGESKVRVVDDRFRRQRIRAVDYPQQVWQLTATARTPVEYVPKERTTYWE